MRAPFQVLVIPFRRKADCLQYCLLRRSDAGYWQFVAGGGDDAETPVEAAGRETREEIGITGEMIPLDSMCMVSRECFAGNAAWGPDVFVIPEHCFAVDAGREKIRLSAEHSSFQWLAYPEAAALLKWDSNRTALWELNKRLTKKGG
ncbi:MAG: NUDIX hydrolase [Candidatus Sumerlaeia bacterium]